MTSSPSSVTLVSALVGWNACDFAGVALVRSVEVALDYTFDDLDVVDGGTAKKPLGLGVKNVVRIDFTVLSASANELN